MAKIGAKDFPLVREAAYAEWYTAKWHLVHGWAHETLRDEGSDWSSDSPRQQRVRLGLVRRLDDDEEAYKRSRSIAEVPDFISPGPSEREGGRRRVTIRLYCWVIDREFDWAYDPEWIKVGDDMSARAAAVRAIHWARAYTDVLVRGMESREIRFTQVEIAFWTTVCKRPCRFV